jgi:hypothetical protein
VSGGNPEKVPVAGAVSSSPKTGKGDDTSPLRRGVKVGKVSGTDGASKRPKPDEPETRSVDAGSAERSALWGLSDVICASFA